MWPPLRTYAARLACLTLGVLLSATVGVPGGVHAQTAPAAKPDRTTAVKKARDHFQKGQRLFTVSRYREALEEFKEAFVTVEDPVFLYNIAQCHRLLGEKGEAVRFYRRYAEAAPGPAERARAEKWIAELEGAGAVAPTATGNAAAVTPVPAPVGAPPPAGSLSPPPIGSVAPPPVSSGPPAGPAPPVVSPPPPPSLAAQAGIEPAPVASEPVPSVSFTAPPPDPGSAPPIYKRWWFWAGVGAVVVIGGAVAAAAGKRPLTCGMGFNQCTQL